MSLAPKAHVVLVLVLVLAGPSACRVLAGGSADELHLTHAGLERTYRLHVPPGHDRTPPAPLMIVLHGGGGDGRGMPKLTEGGFDRLADREGFIVAYPDGIENHWNDGRGNESYRAQRERVDDVGFMGALIDALAASHGIDRARVYV